MSDCKDPREVHKHWCRTCGAELMFSRLQCDLVTVSVPCPRCGDAEWGDEVDEITAPDFKEP